MPVRGVQQDNEQAGAGMSAQLPNLTPAYSFTHEELAILGACLSATVFYVATYGVQSEQADMAMESPEAVRKLIVKMTAMMEALMS